MIAVRSIEISSKRAQKRQPSVDAGHAVAIMPLQLLRGGDLEFDGTEIVAGAAAPTTEQSDALRERPSGPAPRAPARRDPSPDCAYSLLLGESTDDLSVSGRRTLVRVARW